MIHSVAGYVTSPHNSFTVHRPAAPHSTSHYSEPSRSQALTLYGQPSGSSNTFYGSLTGPTNNRYGQPSGSSGSSGTSYGQTLGTSYRQPSGSSGSSRGSYGQTSGTSGSSYEQPSGVSYHQTPGARVVGSNSKALQRTSYTEPPAYRTRCYQCTYHYARGGARACLYPKPYDLGWSYPCDGRCFIRKDPNGCKYTLQRMWSC